MIILASPERVGVWAQLSKVQGTPVFACMTWIPTSWTPCQTASTDCHRNQDTRDPVRVSRNPASQSASLSSGPRLNSIQSLDIIAPINWLIDWLILMACQKVLGDCMLKGYRITLVFTFLCSCFLSFCTQWYQVIQSNTNNLNIVELFQVCLSNTNNYMVLYNNCNRLIGIGGRVFANDPGDGGSIRGRVIPMTLKMVLDT